MSSTPAQPGAEAALDRLASLTARTLQVPVAVLSLAGADGTAPVGGSSGLGGERERELAEAHGLCREVMRSGRALVVEDMQADAALRDHVLVRELGTRAYVGVPLVRHDGRVLGSLCAVDRRPRRWGTEELALLGDLAASAVTELALHADLAERTRLEGQLRESEERFRLLVESTREHAILMLDPAGRIVSWNAGGAAITGFQADEVIGTHFRRFHLPGDLATGRAEHELRVAREQGRFEERGWRLRRDGSAYLAHVVITALRDEHGVLRGFSKVTRDLTDEQRAEDERAVVERERERERMLLGALLAQAPVGIAFWDAELRCTHVNEAFAAMNGRPVEAHLGRPVADVLPELAGDAGARLAAVLETGEPIVELEVTGRVAGDPGGERTWLTSCYAVRSEAGATLGVATLAADVTERRRAADELREQAALLDLAHDATIVRDPRARIRRWNRAAEDLYGWSAEEAAGQVAHELLGTVFPESAAMVDVVLEREGRWEGELRHRARDGREVVVLSRQVLQRDEHGRPVAVLEINTDITGLRTTLERLGESEQRQRTLIETAPDAILGVDGDGMIVLANPRVEALLGYTPDELVGRPLDLLVPERARAQHHGQRAGYQRHPTTRPMGVGRDLTARRKDGSEVPVEISLGSTRTDQGLFTTAVVVDISERKAAERRLLDREERLRTLFEHAPIGVALVDARAPWPIVQANPALGELLGHAPNDLVGSGALSFVEPDDLDATRERLERLLTGQVERVDIEPRLLRADGQRVWASVHASAVTTADGPRHLVMQVQDVGERKRFEGQLKQLADHDSMTGLFNRRRFEEELARALAAVERRAEAAALVVIDLDDFKSVNDGYGHAVGDALLVRVAQAMRERLRATDVVARLGGDEFAVILPATDERRAAHVAEELARALSATSVPAAGTRVHATVSIGVAPVVPGAGLTANDLLVEADLAMYAAKESGRNRVALADAAGDRQHELRARMRWAQRIQEALGGDGFEFMIQPIACLATGEVRRHELLLRMRGEEGELIPPGVFLQTAERSGLIGDIDRWVVARALRLLEAWHAQGRTDVLEVNLSGATLGDARTMDAIVREVAAAQVDHSRLVLEVTETAAITNVERARTFAGRLAALGCQFALDDFGTGFGSFYYLKHLPFDCLKIDGDFIRSLPTSPRDQLTVKAIVDIARGLGKLTIAEFVEDEATLALLRELGVDHAQGYHVGRPVPLGRFSRAGREERGTAGERAAAA